MPHDRVGHAIRGSFFALGCASFLLFAFLPFAHASDPGHEEEHCPATPLLMSGAVALPAPPAMPQEPSLLAPAPVCDQAVPQAPHALSHSPRGPPA